jgi:ADP-ribose pyrophosphatase YjhB (NUDIX family)
MKGNEQIRKNLDDIIHLKNPVEHWYVPELFEKFTKEKIPFELSMIAPPPPEEKNYNCYIYALGLSDDKRFLGNANWDFMRSLHTDFDAMIALGILKQIEKPENGCLVMWRTEQNVIAHVGLMENFDTAISKWSWGPLFRHHIYNVPASYGDNAEFYVGLPEAREYVKKQRDKNHFVLRDTNIFPNAVTALSVKYEDRLAVKVILFDKDNKLALVGTKHRLLPGGGVDEHEGDEDAAKREMREEVGCEIKIIREVAKTEEFRDKIGRHQYAHFFIAEVVGEKRTPQTTQADELGVVVEWHTLADAITILEKQKNEISFEDYNACFNVRTHLHVLKVFQENSAMASMVQIGAGNDKEVFLDPTDPETKVKIIFRKPLTQAQMESILCLNNIARIFFPENIPTVYSAENTIEGSVLSIERVSHDSLHIKLADLMVVHYQSPLGAKSLHSKDESELLSALIKQRSEDPKVLAFLSLALEKGLIFDIAGQNFSVDEKSGVVKPFDIDPAWIYEDDGSIMVSFDKMKLASAINSLPVELQNRAKTQFDRLMELFEGDPKNWGKEMKIKDQIANITDKTLA